MNPAADANALFALLRVKRPEFELDVDLELPGSGISVLFGHSGSGKTTVIRCLAGLEQPDYGFIQVNASVWQDSDRKLSLPTYQRPIGYVFQEASLFPHLSVQQNLDYGLKRTGQRGRQALDTAIGLLGIGELLQRKPTALSGGERQRVAIARALAVDPKVLLMDEPLASLDPQRKQDLLPYFKTLQRELDIPLVYVTHSPQEVTQLADYLVVLDRGKVRTHGPVDTVLTELDSPLAQGEQASAVIRARLVQHEPEHHLSLVSFSGGIVHVPYLPQLKLGQRLRLRIYARDVSISTQQPVLTSILNSLPASITDIQDHGNGQIMLKLDLEGTAMLARITHKSLIALGLQPGMAVYAQIKATSILN